MLYLNNEELLPALKKDELTSYFMEYEKGSLEAREKLILHNLRLIKKVIANNFQNSRYELDDLMSAGIEGLIKAVDTYNYTIACFSTYAYPCIYNQIAMYIRSNELRVPTISTETTLSVDDDDFTIGDTLESEDNTEDDVESLFVSDIVNNAVNTLPEKERNVISAYFGLNGYSPCTLEKIGKEHHVTRECIRNILKKTLNLLRTELLNYEIYDVKNPMCYAGKILRQKTSLYLYFYPYSKEEIDEVLYTLSKSEIDSLISKFGYDFNKVVQVKGFVKYESKDFFKLKYKMMNMLKTRREINTKKYERKI